MELVFSRQKIIGVAAQWRATYSNGLYPEKEEIAQRLDALDMATATPADVAAIIGNNSWSHFRCDECGTSGLDRAVRLGDEWSDRVDYCASCLRAAAALACVALP